jgi:hypothetical protein
MLDHPCAKGRQRQRCTLARSIDAIDASANDAPGARRCAARSLRAHATQWP